MSETMERFDPVIPSSQLDNLDYYPRDREKLEMILGHEQEKAIVWANAKKVLAELNLSDLAITIKMLTTKADQEATETIAGLTEKYKVHRLEVAKLVFQAREAFIVVHGKRVTGNYKWEDWCKEHISNRSKSDLVKLLRIGGAADPEKAYEESKLERRLKDVLQPDFRDDDDDGKGDGEGSGDDEGKGTNAHVIVKKDPVESVLASIGALSQENQIKVYDKIAHDPAMRGAPSIPDEARQVVLQGEQSMRNVGYSGKKMISLMDSFVEAGGSDETFGVLFREAIATKSPAKQKSRAKPEMVS